MSAASPHPPNAVLRVMTFNVRYGTATDGEHSWPFRRRAALAALVESRPHVIGLQEAQAFQLDELDAALPNFGRLGVGRDDGISAGEHAAILYDRTRLNVVSHGDFWFSDTPEAPGSSSWGNENVRMCTFALLADRETGRRFWHYNLHIDHASHFSRINSVRLLLCRIGEREPAEPFLVTGDFNVGETDEAIGMMQAAGLTDAFRAANPDAKNVATYHGFAGKTDGDRIDYIFCSAEWSTLGSAIVTAQFEGHWPSDHFPLVADLILG